MEDMKKMLGKKGKEDPMQKDAKLSALKGLRDEMSSMMQDGLKGKMNKVVVAADDKEGLKKGLDKAKDVLEGSPEEESSESPEMEASENESPEMEAKEEKEGKDLDGDMELGEDQEHQDKVLGNMSAEDIDLMLEKLMDLKKHLAQK